MCTASNPAHGYRHPTFEFFSNIYSWDDCGDQFYYLQPHTLQSPSLLVEKKMAHLFQSPNGSCLSRRSQQTWPFSTQRPGKYPTAIQLSWYDRAGHEAMVFDSVINSDYLKHCEPLLFFAKVDLFQEKVEAGTQPIKRWLPSYQGRNLIRNAEWSCTDLFLCVNKDLEKCRIADYTNEDRRILWKMLYWRCYFSEENSTGHLMLPRLCAIY